MTITPGTINATRIRSNLICQIDPLNWWRENNARFFGLKRFARLAYIWQLGLLKHQHRLNGCFRLLEISVVDGVPAYLLII